MAKATLSEQAAELVNEYVVTRGYSYEDAIARLEGLAKVAAAPYKDAADEIRRWHSAILERERNRV